MTGKPITDIVWDWNGTLLDDVWLCLESINTLLHERRLAPVSRSRYLEIFGFPVRDYYQRAGFSFDQEPFEKPAHEFIRLYDLKRTACALHPQALDMLGFFSDKQIRQHVLSASESGVLHHMLEHFGIRKFFQTVQGLNNHLAAGKSELAGLLARQASLQADQTILIGDTCHDLEVARHMGWACILYSGGHYSRTRLTGCGLTVIDRLSELKTLLFHSEHA